MELVYVYIVCTCVGDFLPKFAKKYQKMIDSCCSDPIPRHHRLLLQRFRLTITCPHDVLEGVRAPWVALTSDRRT